MAQYECSKCGTPVTAIVAKLGGMPFCPRCKEHVVAIKVSD